MNGSGRLRHVPPVLAAAARRPSPRRSAAVGAQGHPRGRVLRRGHHVDGRRGGPRRAGRGARGRRGPASCCFATPSPGVPRQDQRHRHPRRARPRPRSRRRVDLVGAVRSASARCSRRRRGAGPDAGRARRDMRTGLPGGADERDGGDGAAALLFGDRATVVAEIGRPRRSAHRASSSTAGARRATPRRRPWEERFGEHAYVPLAEEAVDRRAEVGRAHGRRRRPRHRHRPARAGRARRVRSALGARPEALVDDLTRPIGNPGAAQAGLAARRRARPGRARPDDRVVVRWPTAPTSSCCAPPTRCAGYRARRHTDRAPSRSPPAATTCLRRRSSPGGARCDREPPRRPDPDRPPAPPASRRTSGGSSASSEPLRRVRLRAPAAGAGVHATAAPSTTMTRVRLADVAGHDRHLHRRPAGLLAQPAGGGRGRRLRRRRPLPVRAHRRRPGRRCRSATGSR